MDILDTRPLRDMQKLFPILWVLNYLDCIIDIQKFLTLMKAIGEMSLYMGH